MYNKRKIEIKMHLSQGDERYKLVKPANSKSNIWNYFDSIQFDGKMEDFACCKMCKDVLAYTPKTGTGSLIRHNCYNQNGRRKTTTNRRKQKNARKDKSAAARPAAFDPLYVQSVTTPQGLYTVKYLYEEGGGVGDVDGGCGDNSMRRNYSEAFNDTSSALAQHDSNPDPNDNDCVYGGNYDDIGYQMNTEPNLVAGGGDIDGDLGDAAAAADANNMDDAAADADDDDQSPVDDVHCSDEDVTTSDFNLMELLMQSNEGQSALSYYDLHNHLDVKHREVVFNTLINIINSTSECRKYNENLRRISYELRQLFPKENYSTLELHKYSMRLEMSETPQQEDLKLYYLLNSWSLAHLYDHFRAENLTLDVVKIMETKHIDRLFRNLTIGDNVLFDHHFKKWLENGSPEPLINANLQLHRKVLPTSQNRSHLHAKVHEKQSEQPTTNGTTFERSDNEAENIVRAIRAIKHFKTHTVAGASRFFQVSRTTLYTYLNKLSNYHDLNDVNDEQMIDMISAHSYNAGGRVFSDKEEKSLVAYIKHFCDNHHALTLNELREFAYKFAKENNSNCPASWDQEKAAGRTWCYGFMRRHRSISLQTEVRF